MKLSGGEKNELHCEMEDLKIKIATVLFNRRNYSANVSHAKAIVKMATEYAALCGVMDRNS